MSFSEVDLKEAFPLMTFERGEEEICRKYMKSRGIYLYAQIYDALLQWQPDTSIITYKQFSNQIRYDKSIGDKLYIYLAAAEEHLRNIIFKELEIDEKFTVNDELKIDELRVRSEKDPKRHSNLYYYSYAKNFNLGLIEKVFEEFDLAEKYEIRQRDISVMRQYLRNKIMHHNMLLLSSFIDRPNIEQEIEKLEKAIEALYRLLPTKELRDGVEVDGRISGGLTQAINKSNYPNGDIHQQPYDIPIALHKFKDGGFIR